VTRASWGLILCGITLEAAPLLVAFIAKTFGLIHLYLFRWPLVVAWSLEVVAFVLSLFGAHGKRVAPAIVSVIAFLLIMAMAIVCILQLGLQD
jgi:hypothetical protein